MFLATSLMGVVSGGVFNLLDCGFEFQRLFDS